MARTALVTGGTRGIGKAISEALKAKGYNVAANYGGNDAAAAEFSKATGIKVFKFDVADYDAVGAGLKAIEAESARSTSSSTMPASRATRRSTR